MDEGTCDNFHDLSSVVSDSFLSKITVRTKPVKTKEVLHNIEENSQVENYEEKVENEANSEIDSPTVYHKKKHKLKRKHSEYSQSENSILQDEHGIEPNAESNSESPTVKHHKKHKNYEEMEVINKSTLETSNIDRFGKKRKRRNSIAICSISQSKNETDPFYDIKLVKKAKSKRKTYGGYQNEPDSMYSFEENYKIEDDFYKCDSPIVQHKKGHKYSEYLQDEQINFEEKVENEANSEIDSPTVHRKKKHKHSEYSQSENPILEDKHRIEPNAENKSESPTVKHHKKHKSKKKEVHDLNNINCSMAPKKNNSKYKLIEDDNEMKCSSNSVISSSIILENILKSEREALYRNRHSISKKKRQTKQEKSREICSNFSDQPKNKLKRKKSPEYIPEESNKKKMQNKKKRKHNIDSITSRNRQKRIFRGDSNEIEIMRDILLKKAMENTKSVKTNLKASVECSAMEEDKHKESFSEIEKNNLLHKNKKTKHKEGKNKCIQIKANKMDMQHIQQSLLDKALKTLNSEPENVKGSIKSKSSKIKSKIKNDLKIKRIKSKEKSVVMKDPKVETGGTKKKKKAKTKDELEEMTSKLLSAALTSKSR